VSAAQDHTSHSQSGMTLVEVTVASVIFAMIMLAVVTAMRTFGQTYDRLQDVTDRTSQKREVDRFLRQALRDALPDAGYFGGTARWVRWVAPIDRVGSAGGLQHLKLESGGNQLLLSFAPFDRFADPQDEPDWGVAVDATALLDDLESLRISYRSLPEEDWSATLEVGGEGNATIGIPWAIQLEITSDVDWPPIIVAFERYGRRG